MTATPNKGRLALKVLPLMIVPVVFLSSAPWLKTMMGGPAVSWVAAAAAIFVMGYAWHLSIRWQRRMDEVQKAQAGFAAQWGAAAGQIAFMLFLVLPPTRDAMSGVITHAAPKAALVPLAMVFGACGVLLLQAIGTVAASLIWWKSHQ